MSESKYLPNFNLAEELLPPCIIYINSLCGNGIIDAIDYKAENRHIYDVFVYINTEKSVLTTSSRVQSGSITI